MKLDGSFTVTPDGRPLGYKLGERSTDSMQVTAKYEYNARRQIGYETLWLSRGVPSTPLVIRNENHYDDVSGRLAEAVRNGRDTETSAESTNSTAYRYPVPAPPGPDRPTTIAEERVLRGANNQVLEVEKNR